MTAEPGRKRRGAATQAAVAAWLRDHGWPFAESAGAGRQGSDITGVPGLACEVKARAGFSPLAWIRQAAAGQGLPFVVIRCNGQGERTVADWPVMLRLADFTALLREAGYGEPAKDCTHGGDCPVHPDVGALHNFDRAAT